MTEPARPAALPVVSRRFTSLVNLFFHYNAVVLVIVQGILLVPLYLRSIPVATYGAWLATGSILSWIDLVDPGLSDVLRQRVAYTYGKGDVAALSVSSKIAQRRSEPTWSARWATSCSSVNQKLSSRSWRSVRATT